MKKIKTQIKMSQILKAMKKKVVTAKKGNKKLILIYNLAKYLSMS